MWGTGAIIVATLDSKAGGVVMVVDNEFKSQTCTAIHDTSNEQLERLRCCELPKSVQTHTILVWKVDKGQARFFLCCHVYIYAYECSVVAS